MDWNAAIEKNREALKRVLAMLVAMAAIASGSHPGVPADPEPVEGEPRRTLPRHLHRAVLSLLRPAESAARRLIIVAARGIVVALPPARPRKPRPTSTILRNGIGTGILMPRGFRPSVGPSRTAPRTLALPLLDPLPRWSARARPAASGFPRISIPGLTQPFPVPRAPSSDDPIDAARLNLRLGALGRALDDLPREARRFARWRARAADAARKPNAAVAQKGKSRAAGRFRRVWPLRPGRPPGGRLSRTIRTHGAAGRISATSTRSWRAPTRWPATRSAPTRHDAGDCLAECSERETKGQTAERQGEATAELGSFLLHRGRRENPSLNP